MLAEGIHSVADSGNQVLLLLRRQAGQARGHPGAPVRLRPRALHLLVHRRHRAVLGRRPVRALRGLPQVRTRCTRASPTSCSTAAVVGGGRRPRSGRSSWRASPSAPPSARATTPAASASWLEFIRRAKSPELPVILLEDFAALIGLVLALLGVGLSMLTGNGYFDVAGTAAIGLLLVGVAVVLGIETKSLLLGESASPRGAAAGCATSLEATDGRRAGHPHEDPAPRPRGAARRGEDRRSARSRVGRRRGAHASTPPSGRCARPSRPPR